MIENRLKIILARKKIHIDCGKKKYIKWREGTKLDRERYKKTIRKIIKISRLTIWIETDRLLFSLQNLHRVSEIKKDRVKRMLEKKKKCNHAPNEHNTISSNILALNFL